MPLQTNYEFSELKCGKNKGILYSGHKHTAKKGSELKKIHSIQKKNGKAFRYIRIKVRFCCVTETLMGGAGNTAGKKKRITFLFLAVLLQEIKNKAKGMGF